MRHKYQGSPTTRTFPRSVNDAFRDVNNSEWFYPPENTWMDRTMYWTGIAMWVGLIIYFVVTA